VAVSSTLLEQNIALRRAFRELAGHGGRALEVGCGTGRFLRTLRRLGLPLEGHGLDIDGSAIAAARYQGDGVSYIVGNLTCLPYA